MNRFKNNKIVRSIREHKRNSFLVLAVILVLIFLFRPKPATPVETETVKKGAVVVSVSGSGTVVADKSVDLSFLTAGKLVYLSAKKGDQIQAGQVIATLDQQTIQKNLESALIDYSKQRNTFDATRDANQNRTPQQALNDQMKRVLEDNQYDLNKAIVSVELQDLARQNAVLVSPIGGIMTRSDVTQAGVNIGPTNVFTISDPTTLGFHIDVDEADIGKLAVGQTVKVNLDAYPNETLNLPVTSIDFASHATTTGGTAYTVEVELPYSGDYRYRIGMTGNGEVITNQKNNVLTVSLSAIQNDSTVLVKTTTGFRKQKVVLGMQNDTVAEVTRGVQAGDQVAAQPSDVKAKQIKS